MKKQENIVLRSVCGTQYLIAEGEENMDFNQLVELNETAAFLWEAMGDGDFTVEELVEKLTGEYEVSQDIARENVLQLLNELKKVGAVC